jgi:hypothetical protein
MPKIRLPRSGEDWAVAAIVTAVLGALAVSLALALGRTVVILVRDPVLGSICFGSAAAAVLAWRAVATLIGQRRRERQYRHWSRVRGLNRADLAGYREVLTRMARRTSHELTNITSEPAAFDGLVYHARRGNLRTELQPFADRLGKWWRWNSASVLAIASLHADGHVREAAVARMGAHPQPAYVPFLAERAVDWVKPVREQALAGLRRMLAHDKRGLPIAAVKRPGPAGPPPPRRRFAQPARPLNHHATQPPRRANPTRPQDAGCCPTAGREPARPQTPIPPGRRTQAPSGPKDANSIRPQDENPNPATEHEPIRPQNTNPPAREHEPQPTAAREPPPGHKAPTSPSPGRESTRPGKTRTPPDRRTRTHPPAEHQPTGQRARTPADRSTRTPSRPQSTNLTRPQNTNLGQPLSTNPPAAQDTNPIRP